MINEFLIKVAASSVVCHFAKKSLGGNAIPQDVVTASEAWYIPASKNHKVVDQVKFIDINTCQIAFKHHQF